MVNQLGKLGAAAGGDVVGEGAVGGFGLGGFGISDAGAGLDPGGDGLGIAERDGTMNGTFFTNWSLNLYELNTNFRRGRRKPPMKERLRPWAMGRVSREEWRPARNRLDPTPTPRLG